MKDSERNITSRKRLGRRDTSGRCFAILLALGMLVQLSACGKRIDVQPGDPFIYCLNSDRTGLIKVSYEIEETDAQDAATAMLEELKKPAEDIEYSPPIPENVSVNSFSIQYNVAYLDFGAPYQEIDPLEEKLVRAAVVQSLTRIDGISGVRISVEGEPLKNSDGSDVGILNGDDFVSNEGASLSSYEKTTLTLYFTNETGENLTAQKMDVKYNSNMSREKLIVEKLLQGPKKGTAYPTLNPSTTVLSVTLKDDICYVNFGSEFLNSTYNVKPEVAIYSLVNSLVGGTSAEKVQIMVNGEKNVKYKDTVDLSQPFTANWDWMEHTDEE